MKHMELYRKIAILLYEAHYEVCIADVCEYLNAEAGFFDQHRIYDLKKYIKHNCDLPKKVFKKIQRAEKEAVSVFFETKTYSLAQEFAMISTALNAMDHWEGFKEDNPEIFHEADACYDSLEQRIITECETDASYECDDLMTDGKIPEECWGDAILRYMRMNGSVPIYEEEE